MLFFPNAKINIGLNVIQKKADGYHDIETLMYPVGLRDIMEFVENKISNRHIFTYTGIHLPGNEDLCADLVNRLEARIKIPPLEVHLHKNIPPGTGLGGGSADVTFFMKKLIECFDLPLNFSDQLDIALETGSDCPFFLYNRPMIATGRGEVLRKAEISLRGYYLVLVMPAIHISTQKAYSAIKPTGSKNLVSPGIKSPIEEWKDILVNQFEEVLFPQYPELKQIKDILYRAGAIYVSMSGTGSGIYGIFRNKVKIPDELSVHKTYSGKFD